MKCVILCILAVMAVSLARPEETPSRGCRYISGVCVEECPVGEHAYASRCGYLMPEATCRDPNPQYDKDGRLCDFSSCYCDPPTVRDENTYACVTVDKCLNTV